MYCNDWIFDVLLHGDLVKYVFKGHFKDLNLLLKYFHYQLLSPENERYLLERIFLLNISPGGILRNSPV